ncbi:MAG TPA: ATP-binding protein [Burkholderiales bacterium]|nr:ATP-binding protein [Burkholderiales bacterium]
MKKPEVLRSVSLGLGALALVAALVFLYDRTQAVDLQDQSEILSYLRVLKEIDSRWDVDVLRARFESGADLPAINRGAAAKRALRDLNSALRKTPSPSLSAGLPQLSEAILQKADLVEKFRIENSAAKAALDDLVSKTAEAQTQTGELKLKVPPQALVLALARAAAAASQYYWLVQDAQRKSLEAALAALPGGASALPETLRNKVEQTREAGEAFIKRRLAEQQTFEKLAFLSSGPRLDSLTFSFSRELEATLQEKELFRVYLIAYAGALLILIGWLGTRLKAANVSLEQRVRDRTLELSQALQHLRESEAQLIQSEKMSSLGQMVAGVAHEINTPLAYVKNSLGTVADKLGDLGGAIEHCEKLIALLQAGGNADPKELSREFALASAAVARLRQQRVTEELGNLVKDGLYGAAQMAEIVGNLKDFSRLDRSKVTHFSLNEGLNSTLVLAKHLLKSVTIDKRFGDMATVVCSPSQVNQVFLNLITNAVQAMEGGRGKITLTTRTDGGGVAVEVADTGRGIPPEVLPKIFDPFFSTKEVGKGTGLGLSVSYKIVQQHGGHIDVESQPGAGTRFTVWFPFEPPAAAGLAA